MKSNSKLGILTLLLLSNFIFQQLSSVAAGCSDHLKYRQEPDLKSVGMHIVCAVPTANPPGISLSGILDAVADINFNFSRDAGSILPVLQEMFKLYGTSNNRQVRKWKVFTTQGSPIHSIDSLLYHRTAIIHTNGHWIWPGVRDGFIQETFDGMKLTTLSVRPLVHRVQNLLTYEECDLIKDLALPYMKASKTSKMDKDRDFEDTEWRTSTQYFLPASADPQIEGMSPSADKLSR
jgi:hypothetical protein